jgi:hypothetical protein
MERHISSTLVVLSVLAAMLLAGCGTPRTRPDIPRDRFGLAAQADVYVIHHTARKPFSIVRKGDRGGLVTVAPAGAIAAITNNFDAARLQQKFDLEDPALEVKARIAESLRRELGLTNLRVEAEAVNLLILPKDKEAEGPREDLPPSRASPPGGGSPQRPAAAAENAVPAVTGTFKEKYPTGAVIEVVTQQWGMADYRIHYFASLRLVDLSASKTLFFTRCPLTWEDPINAQKLYFDAGAGIGIDAYKQLSIYTERAESLLYADNAALLKTTLRKAAERCAARIVPRFLGRTQPEGE